MIQGTKRHRWVIRAAVATAVVGAIGVGIVLAEDVWVNRAVAPIWAGKGSVYGKVADVTQGTKLTVIEHDGRWLHVQYQGQDGWIYDSELSTREVGGEGFASEHQSESSGATNANAGKGFTPEDFAAAKGFSEEPLKKLEAQVKIYVTPRGLEKFMAEGRVGENKPK